MKKIIVILLLSIPIFQYRVYGLLVDKLGVGYAYSIDQLLPLIAAIFLTAIIIKKNVPIAQMKKYLLANRIPFLIIILTTLIVHGLMLDNYFMGEEPTTILHGVNANDGDALIKGILRGYHYGVYVLSYLLFYTNTFLYNIVSLILYIFSAIILYIFINLLLNRNIKASLIGVLFFITTPAYMDMFFWQSNISGMPIALAAGLLSLIFLTTYQRTHTLSFYLLSLLFYLSMLKISFTRFHAFIALPLYLCLLPIPSLRWPNIKKFLVVSLPFIAILFSYLLIVFILPNNVFEKMFPSLFPDSNFTGPAITVRGAKLNIENYFVVLSMFTAYLFIPSAFADSYYQPIKAFLLKFALIPTDISLTLFFAIISFGILLVTAIIALKNIRENWGQVMIFALIAIFAHLILTPLFLQGYNDLAGVDQRFAHTGPGNGPGIRYVFVSAMGMSTLIAALTYGISRRYKKYSKKFFIFILLLFSYYSYLNITSYVSALNNIHPGQVAVPNAVLSMVPKDGQKKLLFL